MKAPMSVTSFRKVLRPSGLARARRLTALVTVSFVLTSNASVAIAVDPHDLVVHPWSGKGGATGLNRSPDRGGHAVRSPRAAICGSQGLAGPASPPKGAKVVRSKNLADVARNSGTGKVFWLAPGEHTLGRGPYDQVRPKDRQVFIGAPGAVIDGQNRNLYAFAGDAAGVTISHLTIRNFGAKGDNNNEGVVNHDAAPGWRIAHNTIRDDAGAGVFLGNRTKVVSNCLTRNGQYGFSAYRPRGVHNVLLRHNEISFNNTDDWEQLWPGCGCTGGGKFWDTRGARILDNWVHNNHGPGIWADTDNTEFLIDGNLISDNEDEGLIYEISYNARIVGNRFLRNSWVKGANSNDFTAALYLLSPEATAVPGISTVTTWWSHTTVSGTTGPESLHGRIRTASPARRQTRAATRQRLSVHRWRRSRPVARRRLARSPTSTTVDGRCSTSAFATTGSSSNRPAFPTAQ